MVLKLLFWYCCCMVLKVFRFGKYFVWLSLMFSLFIWIVWLIRVIFGLEFGLVFLFSNVFVLIVMVLRLLEMIRGWLIGKLIVYFRLVRDIFFWCIRFLCLMCRFDNESFCWLIFSCFVNLVLYSFWVLKSSCFRFFIFFLRSLMFFCIRSIGR